MRCLAGFDKLLISARYWSVIPLVPFSGRDGPVIKNGELLALAAREFDGLLTADKGMEYQQNLATLPMSILIVLGRSNRIEDLARAVPAILAALAQLSPRVLRGVAA